MKKFGKCSECEHQFVLRTRLFIRSTLIKTCGDYKKWEVKGFYRCPKCKHSCEFVMPFKEAEYLGIYSRCNKMVDLRISANKQLATN